MAAAPTLAFSHTDRMNSLLKRNLLESRPQLEKCAADEILQPARGGVTLRIRHGLELANPVDDGGNLDRSRKRKKRCDEDDGVAHRMSSRKRPERLKRRLGRARAPRGGCRPGSRDRTHVRTTPRATCSACQM